MRRLIIRFSQPNVNYLYFRSSKEFLYGEYEASETMCVAEDLPSEIVSLSVIPTQEEAPVIAVRAVRVKTRPTWWKDYVVETKVNYR